MPNVKVTVHTYEGGVNAQIETDAGKSVSVCHTDYGLIDVKTDDGKYPFTGYDRDAAAEAVKKALE